ncbi:hypothetical protein OG225_40665 (plasmid) [Nocardia sp. NBC_01377]|uniref:hypothetical protein n=1 Tax=Nocardia TaxID=1817 RepID=UPI001C238838|nr:hypothetical protein [Nocardia noduli]
MDRRIRANLTCDHQPFRHERIEELHGDPDAFDVESVLGETVPVTFAEAPQLEPI